MTSVCDNHVTEYDVSIAGPCQHILPSKTNHSSAGNDEIDGSSWFSATTINWRVLPLWALVAAGVVGNSLVCASIIVERKLQNVTNYFLVSLAVADLFVSLVVMPCCILQELMGNL